MLASSCRRSESRSFLLLLWSSISTSICRAIAAVASLLAPARVRASSSSSCTDASDSPSSLYRSCRRSLSSRASSSSSRVRAWVSSNPMISSLRMSTRAFNVPISESLASTMASTSSTLFRSPVRCPFSSSIVVDFLMESAVTFSCCSFSLAMVPSRAVTSPHCRIAPISASIASALDWLRSRSIRSYFFFSSAKSSRRSSFLCDKSSTWLSYWRRSRSNRLLSLRSTSASSSSFAL